MVLNFPELHTIESEQIRIQAGRATRLARPGNLQRTFYRKRGGEWVGYSFSEGRKGEDILPEEKKQKDFAFKSKSITVQHLIRAADLAYDRGQRCSNGDDRSGLEELGIAVNILRRSRKIELNLLASQVPCKIEELIALEAGLLPCERVCRLLPAVARYLGVNERAYTPETLKFVTPT